MGIEPAAMKLGPPGMPVIPAIDSNAYADMLMAMEPTVVSGSGALMARITRSGIGVQGATMTTSPAPDNDQVFYDGASAIDWEVLATGTYGVAWMPSILAVNVMPTVTAGSTVAILAPQPVFAGTITFMLVEL
jgi:hypothetical protein